MNDDFDPVVDAVLRRASAAVEPEPARLARALRAVQEQVVLGRAAELEPSSNGGSREQTAPSLRLAGKAGAAPALAVLRTPLAFAACSMISAAIGFVFGMRYERTAAPLAATPVVVEVPAQVMEPTPVPSSLVPAEPARAAPLPRVPEVVEPARARSAKARALPASETFGFREVLSYLRRAERAERQGDPALALALLAELDERADANTLREERAVTRVLALCAQGERAAAERALGTVKDSIYANRIAQSCISDKKVP